MEPETANTIMADVTEPSQDSQKAPAADVMNDPSYATNTQPTERGPEESDTCRICRGEGTEQEPLFYPCKCSGSIKFVHQDCLMVWLSHSQKKYCELCKTPFRFTKLYSSDMPKQLPTSVFLRKAVFHILKYVWTWCRGILVGAVWLIGLPFVMRWVWRWIFYLGDAGWARDSFLRRQGVGDYHLLVHSDNNMTGVTEAVTSTIQEAPYAFEAPSGSLLFMIAKKLFNEVIPYSLHAGGEGLSANDTSGAERPRVSGMNSESSLLSDVTFFKSFSVSDNLNRACLDVLEGQIITLLVVATFILIFLIREWVVQQQPIINLAAQNAENAGQENQDEGVEDPEDIPHVDPGEEDPLDFEGDTDSDSDEDDVASDAATSGGDSDVDAEDVPNHGNVETSQAGYRRIDGERLPFSIRSSKEGADAADAAGQEQAGGSTNAGVAQVNDPQSDEIEMVPTKHPSSSSRTRAAAEQDFSEGSTARTRPNMPQRELSSIANGIRRNLEENSHATSPGSPIDDANGPGATSAEEDHSQSSSDSWEKVSNETADHDAGTTSGSRPHTFSQESLWKLPSPTEDQSVDADLPAQLEADQPRADVASQGLSDGTRPAAEADSTGTDSMTVSSASEAGFRTGATDAIPSNPPPTAEHAESAPRSASQISVENLALQEEHPPVQNLRITTRIYEWLWGDIIPMDVAADLPQNEEHIIDEVADEPPFVRLIAGGEPGQQPPAAIDDDADINDAEDDEPMDPEVAAAAAEAGMDPNDPEAIEDAEDLEGILELIGMQGPLTGLFQNAIFSVLLIGITLIVAVGVPYLLGKAVLLLVGSPFTVFVKLPLRIGVGLADTILDLLLLLSNGLLWALMTVFLEFVAPVSTLLPGNFLIKSSSLQQNAHHIFDSSLNRIVDLIIPLSVEGDASEPSTHVDPLWLSTRSHMILKGFTNQTALAISEFSNATRHACTVIADDSLDDATAFIVRSTLEKVSGFLHYVWTHGSAFASVLWNSKSMTLSLTIPSVSVLDDKSLLYWSATDRVYTVLIGYAFLALLGAIYVKRGITISSSATGRRIEHIIVDVLQQAGGIFKVILIISIEMIAFPLYCGILLDIALLPLFSGASLASRVSFAMMSPWTAGFVHWFVGTCYMFHFALFVSMCRKIMRKGVLYFIRDPDDPTFHPVRDVLERNVTTQLRKITFSALVYGVLILLCLGGVVWTLDRDLFGVLPIRWSTNQPSLEFPLDLLFYNFLTPLVIKFFRPSDALHMMYEWWFKGCARVLRLSDFLFGTSPVEEQQSTIRRTLKRWFSWIGLQAAAQPEVDTATQNQEASGETAPRPAVEGRFVRAPAKDQVRIPKGESVFIDVDQDDQRLDGKPESAGTPGREPDMMTKVYIPPYFRLRISLFIVSLWVFAAATGVGTTVLPLLFGRLIFSFMIPKNVEMNDIYAFSLGAYLLGGLFYATQHIQPALNRINAVYQRASQISFATTMNVLKDHFIWTLSFLYVYGLTIFAVPVLLAITFQLYIIIPISTYFGPGGIHVVHLVQDWTLGFLYGRVLWRVLFMDAQSRPGRVLAAVLADGYMRPNARLFTRCFVLPLFALFVTAIFGPALVAALINNTVLINETMVNKGVVFRYAYPACLGVVMNVWMARTLIMVTSRWRGLIRDEVYLIGERLHNFGEKRTRPATTTAARGRAQGSAEVGGGVQ